VQCALTDRTVARTLIPAVGPETQLGEPHHGVIWVTGRAGQGRGNVTVEFSQQHVLHASFLCRASLVTRIRTGRSRVRILVGAQDLYLLQKVPTGCGVHPVCCYSSYRDSFCGVKQLGREFVHSFQCGVQERVESSLNSCVAFQGLYHVFYMTPWGPG
jgi:hypothetical protein